MSQFQPDPKILKYIENIFEDVRRPRDLQEPLEDEVMLNKTLSKPKSNMNFPADLESKPLVAPLFGMNPVLTEYRKKRRGEIKPVSGPVKKVKIDEKILAKVEMKPKLPHFMPSQINIKVHDSRILQFWPYFDDDEDDEAFCKDLLQQKISEHEPRDVAYVPATLVKLVDELKSESSQSTLPMTDEEMFQYLEVIWKNAKPPLTARELRKLHRKASPSLPPENIDGGVFSKVHPSDEVMASYTLHFCQMCNIFDCFQNHGIEVNKKPIDNMLLTPDALPCSEECFLRLETVKSNNYFAKKISERTLRNRLPTLNNNDKTLLNVYMDTYKNNFCAITELMKFELKISCSEVYLCAQDIKKILGKKTTLLERIKVDKNKKKQKSRKKTNAQKRNLGKFYVPCNHPGKSCSKANKCPCAINGTACEKYCICAEDETICSLRFSGCKCSGGCQSHKCLCYMANRECDEDLCKGGSHNPSSPGCLTCKNASIQRGLGKHLLLGKSKVAGWGVFLNGTAEKNDLISQYCGEIVSHGDAEVRGLVYDKIGTSYLFDLIPNGADHEADTCDAQNVGNKIRFANHDPKDPNCYPKNMLVNGLPRIGIYAKRPIHDKEELFFDYGTVKFLPQSANSPKNSPKKS